jgi:hypothetical protein
MPGCFFCFVEMSAELLKFLKELADRDHHPPIPLWIALRARQILDRLNK